MHFGYALVAGVAVAWLTSRRLVQVAAAFYPAFVLLVIVATGNHFLLDALAGAVVVGVAAGGALLLSRPAADAVGLALERPRESATRTSLHTRTLLAKRC